MTVPTAQKQAADSQRVMPGEKQECSSFSWGGTFVVTLLRKYHDINTLLMVILNVLPESL
jgi:hypothetical protein